MHPRFMIGIYSSFDREKFDREWRPWFTGVEMTNLTSWEEALEAIEFTRVKRIQFGIHHPLVKGRYDGFDPHLLVNSPDQNLMTHSIALAQQALTEAKELGAAYLLIHFPKPVFLDPSLDWSDWRFVQPGEAIPHDQADKAQVEQISMLAFDQLEHLSREIGVPLILEMDILHACFYKGMIQELYKKHPGLGLCLDTGRLHLQSATDPEFDLLSFVTEMKPWLTNLHLWTVQLGQNKKGGHHPLLPELYPVDGWGPMGEILTTLSGVDNAWVLFEHRSDLVAPDVLEHCYQWVKGLLSRRQVNEMPVSIRRAEAIDLDFMIKVDFMVDAFSYVFTEKDKTDHRSKVAEFITAPDRGTFICEDMATGERIGLIMFNVSVLDDIPCEYVYHQIERTLFPADGRFLEVYQLWVDPRYRRMGVATKLKSEMEQKAREQGISLLYTHTEATNQKVLDMNAKLGYREVRRGPIWDDVIRVSLIKQL